ncbi:isoleucyl-tRNA synthetase [Pleurotus eryngii]|uniref:Isoleucine--tRNA ligase, mitochondrial n=1 Tax=Pleurotus eryngii TaxID=5323 RepID=A0A9P6D562_PLEER|nr:isoleucyl-tRNA synthetase [Pleurotus eryngii]
MSFVSSRLVQQLRVRRRHIPGLAVTYSTAANKSYSNTLLLPKTSFPLWAEPSKREEPYRRRACEELYRWQWENAKGELFVLHDGPPYANGALHMGHALNKILKDIINRFHVSQGRRVHYIPGWDCHGLPIENKALQELGKESSTASASEIRSAASSTAQREVQSQKQQFQELGIMADWSEASTYRTLDHDYEMRQLRIFQKMVANGLIYRHYRPVHYSPSSRSALAEAELVYKDDHVSHSVFVAFEVDCKSESTNPGVRDVFTSALNPRLLVWTTTPWTLTANMAIAVNPELCYVVVKSLAKGSNGGAFVVVRDRLDALRDMLGLVEVVLEIPGSELVGVAYRPIFSALSGRDDHLEIIAASHVTADSGTGLVHCAPAHGNEDYYALQKLGMISDMDSIICHVGDAGCFTENVSEVVGQDAGQTLVGQDVLSGGSRSVVEILKKTGALIKIQRIKHRYPYDWKTDKPIIVTATSQWFANLEQIKDRALSALQDVSFYPSVSRNRLVSFVASRSEWCISRQRVWGAPILALHHIPTDRAVLTSRTLDHILPLLDAKGVAHWWDGPIEDFVPEFLREEGEVVSEVWRKSTDTMDVWFDSGSSWSMLEDTVRQYGPQRKHLADVCLEGSDQHRGWFQSQLLTAVASASSEENAKTPQSPYNGLITHGMVLDQNGKKMSKSLGNIISPMTVIHGGKDKKKEPAYGTDVLRLWAATAEYWKDIAIGPTVLAQTFESLRKIRNTARFILGNTANSGEIRRVAASKEDMSLADRYIMHELYSLERTALESYTSYNFPKVVNALIHFTNITLSSLYFDITKDCLYANAPGSLERRAVVTVLEQVLSTMIHIYAPILPHLAEEVYEYAKNDTSLPSVFQRKWTPLNDEWKDTQAAEEMRLLMHVRSNVLSLLELARTKKQIKSSLEAEVDIILPDDLGFRVEFSRLLRRHESFLKTLFIVSDVRVTDTKTLGDMSPQWFHMDSFQGPDSDVKLMIRVRPATMEKCPRCWTYTRQSSSDLCQRCTTVV